jgi:bifunctional UDP-N-acetylglucosamine pyrophosphorylase / glucosamine-1-phosphate N-acetyltransferase
MKVAAVVLAAGLGTRMKSSLPKVLHPLQGRPMLQYVVNTLSRLKPQRIVTVVGQSAGLIRSSIHGPGTLSYVLQREPKGTGDALRRAVPSLGSFRGTILVVNGDSPLLTAGTIRQFLARHRKKKNDISLLSFIASAPGSYGRILRDERGKVVSITEERHATPTQREIREVNSGIYAIELKALRLLKEIRINSAKGEYYLTDIVHLARKKGMPVDSFCADSEDEFIGINTPKELERAVQLMKARIVKHWCDQGVRFIDTGSVFISPESLIGNETIIYPNVYIEGTTKIGSGCSIFPNVRISDSTIEDGATVKDSTLIEKSIIKKKASVGPFAHIRPGTTIGENAKIGNFVEVKNSLIGQDTKASHLSYVGDARIGKGVNIGAGTITCNYDGYHKYITSIEDNVFIGSDSQLIAPVKISRGAVVAAGSTITGDVPAYALALSRVKQTNVANWALRRQRSRKYEVDSMKEKTQKLNQRLKDKGGK